MEGSTLCFPSIFFSYEKSGTLELVNHVINAVQQCLHVGRFDGNKGRDAQLVATQLAVRFNIHDAIGAQGLGDCRSINGIVEVDRGDDIRTVPRVLDVRLVSLRASAHA